MTAVHRFPRHFRQISESDVCYGMVWSGNDDRALKDAAPCAAFSQWRDIFS
jgi:hypothetical protein